MAEARFYPDVVDAPSQPDLAQRVAELEQVVATLASLRLERSAAHDSERRDPVALTAALHPGGMRAARKPRRRTSNDGSLPLRFVLFDSSASRCAQPFSTTKNQF